MFDLTVKWASEPMAGKRNCLTVVTSPFERIGSLVAQELEVAESSDQRSYIVARKQGALVVSDLLDRCAAHWAGGALVGRVRDRRHAFGLFSRSEPIEMLEVYAFICQAYDRQTVMFLGDERIDWPSLFPRRKTPDNKH